ncbi:MAG: site-specific integrase [Erysipelotrichaceae bacterium]|nr:site-specific integrase [Erysipelotrichaceae bacterium]
MAKERNITEVIPNQKYRIDIEKGRKHDGSRNRYTETFNGTLKEAINRRDELLYEIKHAIIKPDSDMNFLEYAKLWLKDYAEVNVKASTLAGYKSCLNSHILPRFKDYKLSEITVYEIDKFYNELRKTKSKNPDINGNYNLLSESEVRHQHSLLSVMLNTAVKWDFISVNPCTKIIKPPTVSKKEMQFYDDEELQKLFKYLEYTDLTFKTAIYLLVLGGLRRGEALGLEYSHINYENKTISIKQNLLNVRGKGVYLDTPKTRNSIRTISLPDVCFELIKELKEKQEVLKDMNPNNWKTTDFVLKSEDGNYYNPNRLTRNWVAFIRKYKLKPIRLHSLRHSFATYLLSHNTPVATVSKKLGHCDIYTTLNVYTHSVDNDERESTELLNNMVNGIMLNNKSAKNDRN